MNGHEIVISNDFEEVEIPVPWGYITGKWWGPRNVQPIIALHGWQDNCGTFDKLAPMLREKGFSLYCIDLPGHGFSSHLPAGQNYYIFWDGLLNLRRIVLYFGWSKITVIGHSMGGAIAFLYAATFPNDIKKYISIDIASPTIRNVKKVADILGPAIDKFFLYEKSSADKMPCYKYNDMVELVEDAYAGSVNRQGCEIMLRRGMRPVENKNVFLFTRDPRLKVSALGLMTIEQVLEFASRITCEVMNIRGNPGLVFDNPEYYGLVLDTIEKQAKKLERHVVEGTHHLHLNSPESIVTSIYNFLQS